MKFRLARHTNDLVPIVKFYKDILGLEIIGKFKNHENYDGVFLGRRGLDWHLEFTTSNESPIHKPDDDDLLVFYVDTEKQYIKIKERFKAAGIKPLSPKNPYWNDNGSTYKDPDGFRIVISILKK